MLNAKDEVARFQELAVPRRLFHCTHEEELPGLRITGLDPLASRKGDGKLWMCERGVVSQVAVRVALQHGWAESSMVWVAINTATLAPFLKNHGNGEWWTSVRVPGSRLLVAGRPW